MTDHSTPSSSEAPEGVKAPRCPKQFESGSGRFLRLCGLDKGHDGECGPLPQNNGLCGVESKDLPVTPDHSSSPSPAPPSEECTVYVMDSAAHCYKHKATWSSGQPRPDTPCFAGMQWEGTALVEVAPSPAPTTRGIESDVAEVLMAKVEDAVGACVTGIMAREAVLARINAAVCELLSRPSSRGPAGTAPTDTLRELREKVAAQVKYHRDDESRTEFDERWGHHKAAEAAEQILALIDSAIASHSPERSRETNDAD